MAERLTISITGDKELLRAINRLQGPEANKLVRQANNIAVTPWVQETRRRAASIGKRQTISKSIIKKTKTYGRAGVVVTLVGPDADYEDPETGHKPSKTAHLVEFGTKPHVISARGTGVLGVVLVASTQHPGTPPRPFMRPAFDATKSLVLTKFFSEVKKRLIALARKK